MSVFVDGAMVGNRAGPEPLPDSIGGYGVSLAWTPSPAVFARVTYADSMVEVDPVGSRDLQDHGMQFRVVVRPLELLR